MRGESNFGWVAVDEHGQRRVSYWPKAVLYSPGVAPVA